MKIMNHFSMVKVWKTKIKSKKIILVLEIFHLERKEIYYKFIEAFYFDLLGLSDKIISFLGG